MCTVFKPCSRRLSLGRPKVYENTQHRFVAGVTGMIARRRSGKAGSNTTSPTCPISFPDPAILGKEREALG